jgi:hypothetical protein
MMERSGDLSVREVEGFGRRDRFEGESAKEGSVLMHRFLVMRGEGGVAFFEDSGASGALAGEGIVFVVERETEEGGEEASRGLDRGRSRKRSDFVKGEDADATEAGREGDDLGVGFERARRGPKDEERVLKLSIDFFPATRHVIRLETALTMA